MNEDVKLLAVDLDGTLVKSDMLFETFWSAFSYDLLLPLKAFFIIFEGRAKLKQYLYESSDIDIKSLPFNKVVKEYINNHRSRGGKVALITATNQDLANEIAIHLDLFDEVYGSSANKNLNGREKANFQIEKFGRKNFDYIGNSSIDIHCWENSDKAITIDIDKPLRHRCERINKNCIHLKSKDRSNFINNFIKEIRTYQWIKNSLVFLPLLASQNLDKKLLLESSIAFFAFSFMASNVYIINDLLDLKSDRSHPKKSKRPFANGDLKISWGCFGGLGLMIISSILAFQLGIKFLTLLLFYFIVTLGYSLYFKKKVLFDIFILSGLYTLRIVGGGFATSLEISFWLLAFSIFIFLSLAAVKRQAELVELIGKGKNEENVRGYKIGDLSFISSIALGSGLISNLVLALYINSPKVLSLYLSPEFLWFACCLFLFWIISVCFKTQRGEMEYDPIIFAVKDKMSNFVFISIFILVLFAVYL